MQIRILNRLLLVNGRDLFRRPGPLAAWPLARTVYDNTAQATAAAWRAAAAGGGSDGLLLRRPGFGLHVSLVTKFNYGLAKMPREPPVEAAAASAKRLSG